MNKKWNFMKLIIFIASLNPASEAVLNFEDENFFGIEADMFDWARHPCRRPCRDHQEPMTCNYVLVIEKYSSMSKACFDCPKNLTDCTRPHCVSADGLQKTIYTANRQMPAPAIEVCHNDLIVVEIRNAMLAESTLIHWHGMLQTDSPYMDGVPYVTQCPVLPGEKFRYIFKASNTGTYWYHSHIGSQLADGFFGPLIIHHLPKDNVHRNLYDYDEHYVMVNDWTHSQSDAGFVRDYHDRFGDAPATLLVNGRGSFQKFLAEDNKTEIHTPNSVFHVQEGKRYKFRVIGSGAQDCPIQVSVDNHTMKIISLDSEDIEPIDVDLLNLWPGERVNFVLNANQRPGNYWMRFRGIGLCEGSTATNGAHQVAILRYTSAPIEDPKISTDYDIPRMTNNTRVLNPFDRGTENPFKNDFHVPLLNAIDPNDEALKETADKQIFINFDFYHISNYDFHRKNLYAYDKVPSNRRMGSMQLNNISLKLPPFPLLSQRDMIQTDTFCNSTNLPRRCKYEEQCACTHVLQVDLNSVVELVFVDEGEFSVINHPLHLHGHLFRVVAMEKLDGIVTIDRIKQLDREGKIKRRLDRAPKKDTIKAPSHGYTIVQFHANNPGYWFFHCHFEEHYNIGMALIFKVGQHKDFLPIPNHFPRCGSYLPQH